MALPQSLGKRHSFVAYWMPYRMPQRLREILQAKVPRKPVIWWWGHKALGQRTIKCEKEKASIKAERKTLSASLIFT